MLDDERDMIRASFCALRAADPQRTSNAERPFSCTLQDGHYQWHTEDGGGFGQDAAQAARPPSAAHGSRHPDDGDPPAAAVCAAHVRAAAAGAGSCGAESGVGGTKPLRSNRTPLLPRRMLHYGVGRAQSS
jgi:hypothetical protein